MFVAYFEDNTSLSSKRRLVAEGAIAKLVRVGEAGCIDSEGVKILVIDADRSAIEAWRRALDGRASLETASTFEQASERTEPARWRAAPCDYAIVDPRLPGDDEGGLLGRLTRLEPRPLVAVVTELDARVALAVHKRCVVAVPKPLDRELLDAVLRTLEEARSGASAVERFARRFQLSPQETRLLLVAVREGNNDEAANALGCRASTVRSYWARVFQKTHRRSAREVLALLFRFALDPSQLPAPDRASSGLANGKARNLTARSAIS